MSITLHLTTEEEDFLRAATAAEGKDLDSYIRHRVFATAPNRPVDDDVAFLERVGNAAIQESQNRLLAQGIDYVYRRADGLIVRHQLTGHRNRLSCPEHSSDTAAPTALCRSERFR